MVFFVRLLGRQSNKEFCFTDVEKKTFYVYDILIPVFLIIGNRL